MAKNLAISFERSLWARSRFVVKSRCASSTSDVKRRGTGPSRLSQSNREASRGHSASSTVATASLYIE